MYRKIRVTVVAVVVMMMCVLGSTVTLAYFTDTASVSSDFVIGNVKTTLEIYDDVSNADEKRMLSASNYPPLTENSDNAIEIPFYMQAQNAGNIPVYQRFRVVIPAALASMVELGLGDVDCDVTTTECEYGDYIASYSASAGDGQYAVYYIVRTTPLDVDEVTSEWPTTKLKISGVNDANKSLFTCSDATDNHCTLGIRAYSDAIQTTGFDDDATRAFENFTETY